MEFCILYVFSLSVFCFSITTNLSLQVTIYVRTRQRMLKLTLWVSASFVKYVYILFQCLEHTVDFFSVMNMIRILFFEYFVCSWMYVYHDPWMYGRMSLLVAGLFSFSLGSCGWMLC